MKIIYYLLLICAISLGLYSAYIPLKAVVAEYLIKQAWDNSSKNNARLPWGWADMKPIYRLSSLENDAIDFVIMKGDSGNILAFTPGVNILSTDQTTKIISGHNNTHFKFLEKTKIGDKFSLKNLDNAAKKYQVIDKYIIDITKNDLTIEEVDELKLITCYPFDGTTGSKYRLVVKLALVN